MSRKCATYLLLVLHLLALPVGSVLAQSEIWYEWIYQSTDIQRLNQGQEFCLSTIPTAGVSGNSRTFSQVKGVWAGVSGPNTVCNSPILLPDGSPNYRVECTSPICEFATFTYTRNLTAKPVTRSPLTGLPRAAALVREYDSYPQLEYARSGEALMLSVAGLLQTSLWKGVTITIIAISLVGLGGRAILRVAVSQTGNRLPESPSQILSVKMDPKKAGGYDGQD